MGASLGSSDMAGAEPIGDSVGETREEAASRGEVHTQTCDLPAFGEDCSGSMVQGHGTDYNSTIVL